MKKKIIQGYRENRGDWKVREETNGRRRKGNKENASDKKKKKGMPKKETGKMLAKKCIEDNEKGVHAEKTEEEEGAQREKEERKEKKRRKLSQKARYERKCKGNAEKTEETEGRKERKEQRGGGGSGGNNKSACDMKGKPKREYISHFSSSPSPFSLYTVANRSVFSVFATTRFEFQL